MSADTPPIRNYHDSMQYRRFGKTEREISVITLGGMRYLHGWEQPRDEVPTDMLEQAVNVTRLALDAGVNHIETAYGYGKSEHCYGKVLNEELQIPRDSYHLMTKGGAQTADDIKRMVDEQLAALQTDHIDLYGWHGINTAEIQQSACASGGPVEELLKLKEQGVIGSVGFSTHGPVDVICRAVETGLFDFVNLHYYYFFQRNWPAVALAAARDMGVFIISPNDKGGQLFNPSAKLSALTAPWTPIQWNARFCLNRPEIHTLSFGMSEPEHVTEMQGVTPVSVPMTHDEQAVQQQLDAQVLCDPISAYEGHELMPDPSGINIPEVLRFRRMWKCYDMHDFGVYRYNMLQEKGHWFPGVFATPEAVAKVDTSRVPAGIHLKALLSETHQAFFKPKESKE
ncbi:MAG: aldo/keto reductase [Planctomycetota bacterium]|nr:aldo/keto reductase [Planctomycetota bacterium]